MEAEDGVILKAIQEAYNRPDLEVEYISEQDRVVFKAGIREAAKKLERWREQGTHLVSNEAIRGLEELGIVSKV